MSAISITILLFCLSTCSIASTAEEEKQVEERSRPAPSELLLALDAPAQGNGGMQFSYNRDLVALRPKRCRDANLTSEPMFFCPTPNPEDVLEWVCVRASQLCNNVPDCPGGQDEHPTMCMFYNLQNAELNNIRRSVANFMVKQNEKNARRPKQSRIF